MIWIDCLARGTLSVICYKTLYDYPWLEKQRQYLLLLDLTFDGRRWRDGLRHHAVMDRSFCILVETFIKRIADLHVPLSLNQKWLLRKERSGTCIRLCEVLKTRYTYIRAYIGAYQQNSHKYRYHKKNCIFVAQENISGFIPYNGESIFYLWWKWKCRWRFRKMKY